MSPLPPLSADSTAGVIARFLRARGVDRIFALCGGHIMSIYDGCLDEGIGIIDVRHEQSAAHAADGWARVTGQPGVAIVTAARDIENVIRRKGRIRNFASPDELPRLADLVERLMGRKPEARFQFIQENAEFAAGDLDI